MSEVIKRVAGAIGCVNYDRCLQAGPPSECGSCQNKARAAIEAMRDPTNKMLNANWMAIKLTGDFPKGVLSRKSRNKLRWQAMIDVILGT